MGTVVSAPTQIWPYSSLFLPPKFTVSSLLQECNPLHLPLQEWAPIILFDHTPPCCSALLLALPLLIGHPPASLPNLDKGGQRMRLIRAHLVRLSRGNGNPLQYSCLENPMGRGAWWAAVHGVAKSQTRLNNFTFTFHFHALQKEMAAHSSVLAWGILGRAETGGLPSMGSHRVGHDWSNLAAAVVRLRRGRSIAATVGMCRECLQW